MAHRGALDAAGGTVVVALHPDHMRETSPALGRAIIAGIDAVFGKLIQWVIHVLGLVRCVIHGFILA